MHCPELNIKAVVIDNIAWTIWNSRSMWLRLTAQKSCAPVNWPPEDFDDLCDGQPGVHDR
jgi:hypothetical protein